MRFIFDLAYVLAGIAVSPMMLYRMFRQKRYRTGWAERFGKVTRKDPSKECIWIHAVSVGEVNATKTIIAELKERFPHYEIIISTTTDTGFARARGLFAKEHLVFYFPFDFSWVRSRSFENLKPAICLLMELEVWPNFVNTAARLDVPVVVVNGRITERSVRRFKLVRPLVKPMFDKISLILAQTEQYARRFRQIGVAPEKIIVTSSLKYDTAQIADKLAGADELAEQLSVKGRKLWVAGGTGNGEEKLLLEVFKKLREGFEDLRLVIVPRKPERFDEVAGLIKEFGFDLIRYSRLKGTDKKSPAADSGAVILGDTMGDLRKFYSLATVVFVGRSLVPMGGSDMIEAAALGKCTIFGPHTFNFAQSVEALLAEHGAIEVRDKDELLAALQKCLTDPDYARAIARAGQNVIRKNQGATKKTIEQIARLLEQRQKQPAQELTSSSP